MSKNNMHGEKFQHDEDLNKFFMDSLTNMEMKFSTIAKLLNIHDYRTVKRYLDKHRHRFIAYHSNQDLQLENKTTTTTAGYDQKIEPEREYPTLEEYCQKYHIPFDKLTSVKFVNHNGQAAWNAVCDLTKISEQHLNSYFDRLKEAMTEVVIPVILNKSEQSNEASFWFHLSDKHVGAQTNDKAMFGNYYDLNVFRDRMLNSLQAYIDEAHARGGRFDKVFICDLGDSLDGWNQKTTRNSSGHVLPQNANNRESFDAYVKVTIEFMETLIALDLANEYEFVSVTNDNHSSDFGYICNRSVEVYLQVKYPEIKTRILSKFIEHVEYGNHTVMLCHGKDDEHLKHGLPLNIDLKTELFINSYIDAHKLTGTLHFIKGDLHQASTNFSKKFRYRNVLSLYGSSDWSQTNFGPNLAGMSYDIIYKHKNKVLPGEHWFEESSK